MPTKQGTPARIDIDVRFRDVDAMGHVNNAVYFTYMEIARTQFFMRQLELQHPSELPVIVAEASCTFRSAVRFGEKLFIDLSVSRIGNKSFDLGYEIVAEDGRLVGQGQTVMVAYDYGLQQTIPLPDKLRTALETILPEGRAD